MPLRDDGTRTREEYFLESAGHIAREVLKREDFPFPPGVALPLGDCQQDRAVGYVVARVQAAWPCESVVKILGVVDPLVAEAFEAADRGSNA